MTDEIKKQEAELASELSKQIRIASMKFALACFALAGLLQILGWALK